MKKIIGSLAALAFIASAVPAFADDAPAAAPAVTDAAPKTKMAKRHHHKKATKAPKADAAAAK